MPFFMNYRACCQFLFQLRASHRRFLLGTLLLVWLFFTLVVFPSYNYTHHGTALRILDARLHYNAADVETLFAQMGADGRTTYFWQLAIVDMIYPIVYGSMLCFMLIWFCSSSPKNNRLVWLASLPLFAALADMAENINTLFMLARHASVSEWAATIGSIFTFTKWVLATASLAVLAACALMSMLHSGNKQRGH